MPREEGDTYLSPQNYQHPVLKPFAPYATRTPWNKLPVFRYWRIDDLAPDAGTVIAYNDGRPALLERTLRAGQAAGHVLVMSTPFSDRISRRDAWNWLPGSGESGAWPFVVLANQVASFLVGSGEQQLNYFAGANSVSLAVGDGTQSQGSGKEASAPAPASDDPTRYYIARPDGKCRFRRPKKASCPSAPRSR